MNEKVITRPSWMTDEDWEKLQEAIRKLEEKVKERTGGSGGLVEVKEEEEEELLEIVDERPEIWLPEREGEVLEGEIVEIREGEYGIYAMVKEKASGLLLRTPAHKLLQSKLSKLSKGDYIRIIYQGSIRTISGRRAENYKVLKRIDKKVRRDRDERNTK